MKTLKKNLPVLASISMAVGAKLVAKTCQVIGCLNRSIMGRTLNLFVAQLAFGVIWGHAKVVTTAQSRAARSEQRGTQKADAINSLYLELETQVPDLVSRRTCGLYYECVLLGGADEGWIKLPPWCGLEKLPKLTDPKDLQKITWDQLRHLAKKYGSIEALRATLRPSRKPKGDRLFRALMRAIDAIERNDKITPECMPLLHKLGSVVSTVLASASDDRIKSVDKRKCPINSKSSALMHNVTTSRNKFPPRSCGSVDANKRNPTANK
jgi:hypothetical protein